MRTPFFYIKNHVAFLIALALVVCASPSFAGGNPILLGQDEFKNKMNTASPQGYKLLETETDEDEYTATFTKGNDAIIIAIYAVNKFNEYQLATDRKSPAPIPYTLDGMKAVYFTAMGLSYLYLEVKDLNLMVSIAGRRPLGRDLMEKAARELKIQDWKSLSQGISWPAEIIAAQRIGGDILSVEKTDPSTDGFIYEYHVKAVYNKKLVQSVEKILAQYGGDLDVCHMGKFVFISASTDSMAGLRTSFKDGEIVEFIYYRKGK